METIGRRLVENFGRRLTGLIRQFLPKSMRLDNLDPTYMSEIAHALNTRPRKTLGWKTPEQVLSGFTVVALQN